MNDNDTITLPRSVVEQALEALTNCTSEYGHRCNRCDSEVDPDGNISSALRAALEQQVMRETAPNGATHIQPQQGAFYKRVDEKWYVWSRMEDGRPHRWYISPGTVESCLKPISAATEQPQGEQEHGIK